MNNRVPRTGVAGLLFGCIALLWYLSVSPAYAGNRVALVIGNADYPEAPLRNPVNDARAMAKILGRLGFEVIRLENANRVKMEQAIIEFTSRLGADVSGLFYYAGHGVQVKGHNYLIPVDATLASEREVRIEALDVDLVLDELEYADNRLNIFILDACRNNPFERRFRGRSRGLAAVDAARGTLIAYATAPGSVALDGDGENGVYTEELLRVLDRPGLGVEQVFKQVRINVAKRTNSKQMPWESSSLTGEFTFNLSAGPVKTTAADEGSSTNRSGELLFWESIKASDNPVVFRAYLKQYPDGLFTSLAQIKLEELESMEAAARVPASAPRAESTAPASAAAAGGAAAKPGGGEISGATASKPTKSAALTPQPESTRPNDASGPVRITLLPPNTRDLCGECDTEDEVSAVAGDFFRSHTDLQLTHSYQGARLGASDLPYSPDYWKGTRVKKVPNETTVYRVGDSTDADAVLMYVYDSILSKGVWEGGTGRVRVYLFDVRKQTVHQREGTRNDMRKMTEEVMDEYRRSTA